MTDLEKATERLKNAQEIFDLVTHAVSKDRKLSKDGKSNGNYTSALSALKNVVIGQQELVDRLNAKNN